MHAGGYAGQDHKTAIEAGRRFNAGDLDGGISAISVVVAADPECIESTRILACMLILAGRYPEALEKLSGLPESVDTLLLRAKAHESLGDLTAARESTGRAVDLDPTDDDARITHTCLRDRYVTDNEFDMAVSVTLDRAFWSGHGAAIVYAVLRLELLTGRRESDILRIDLRDITDDGIFFIEGKTAKRTLVLWSDELRATVEDVRRICHRKGKIESTRLITNRAGMPVSVGSLNQAWQRLRPWLIEVGIEPFQIRDIRAKHATDFNGDASVNLRHSSKAVTEKHYIRKPVKVRSLR